MGALSILLILAGIGIALVGNIQILIMAFRESVLWGLGILFVPFVGLIFVVMRWQDCWKPFLTNVAGIVVLWIGMGMGVASQVTTPPDFSTPPPAEQTVSDQ